MGKKISPCEYHSAILCYKCFRRTFSHEPTSWHSKSRASSAASVRSFPCHANDGDDKTKMNEVSHLNCIYLKTIKSQKQSFWPLIRPNRIFSLSIIITPDRNGSIGPEQLKNKGGEKIFSEAA